MTTTQKLRSWLGSQWGRLRQAVRARTARVPQQRPPDALPAPVLACATVVIPALNEAARIAQVVRHALADPATAEVIVVDDSSIDDTVVLAREAGAVVITSTMLGKGASMRDGLHAARCDLVVYLDGDLSGLREHIVTDLCWPLVQGEADFVKACFGRGGGRVTELTAKPMIKVFFPELARFAQPLGGMIAARAGLLSALHFEDGYGVDIGLLLDAHRAGARLAEVDIGSLEHDSQPLLDLTVMANEVSRVIYARARAAGRLHVEQIAAMYETQRQATATLDYSLTRRRGRTRLVLLDMDGTVTPDRYVVELARATGREAQLAKWLDSTDDDTSRGAHIAGLFKFVHRRQFEQVARTLAIRAGVVSCVNQLRRAGFMVGLVSDSYFIAAEILRRRIFADFALAHTLQFDGDVCNGELRLNEAFMPLDATSGGPPGKQHVVQRFRLDPAEPRLEEIWAVGDNANDLPMLQEADRAFVIDPKAPNLVHDADAQRIDSFEALEALIEDRPDGAETQGQ